MTSSMMHRQDSPHGEEQNLSWSERAIYIAVGLGLAAAGAKPRPNPLLNVLALAGGSYLAWRGYVGQCPLKAMLVDSRDSGQDRFPGHRTGDRVAQYSH
ncbi:YgaP family membrane protein [Microvirga massiliensis]|uniref:YgaP family membrane protein n=1 Tax=Microvirga massiliensis TaxID=1033741 RepID=UPI000ADCA79B